MIVSIRAVFLCAVLTLVATEAMAGPTRLAAVAPFGRVSIEQAVRTNLRHDGQGPSGLGALVGGLIDHAF